MKGKPEAWEIERVKPMVQKRERVGDGEIGGCATMLRRCVSISQFGPAHLNRLCSGRKRQSLLFNLPIFSLVLFLPLLLAACAGGPRQGEATALPADIVRPAQPTPIFANSALVFRLTPDATPMPTAESPAQLSAGPAPVPTLAAYAQLRAWLPSRPPTAMAIVRNSTPLLDGPAGAVLEQLGAGATVTVTGRAADGRTVAAFTATGVPGWIRADALFLYGADDLIEVDQTLGPGPVATMIAEAMQ